MTRPALTVRLSRVWAFARHIPMRKIARRIALTARRKMMDRFGWDVRRYASACPPLSETLPLPIFAPRPGLMSTADGGLSFTFIGRTHTMGDTFNWGTPGPGPQHQLWRMNLHYMEYLEDAPDETFCALIEAWIVANPLARGAWRDSWNSYALSLRTLVWMQQIARRRAFLTTSFIERACASLWTQLQFLADNLETDLGGNHLVKNIKTLVWASAFFAGPDVARLRATGMKHLAEVLEAQILPDGVHDERSPAYHCQVFADLLECRHVVGKCELDRTLTGMAQVIADLSHPDGRIAQFNDSGLDMAYAPGDCLDVFERIFGARPSPRKAFSLPSAGYFGFRDGGDYLVADCGRIAPDDLPAHGHGDLLSFEWSIDGKRFLVDQGVYEYFEGAKRQQSRSASAHNTLCLEGADQADFFGSFRCGRRPSADVRSFDVAGNGFVLTGSHDGFANLPGRPLHVRQLEASRELVRIRDVIEGKTDRKAHLGFLLHPDVAAKLRDGFIFLSRGKTLVRMESTCPMQIEEACWWPNMGIEILTRRIRITIDRGQVQVITSMTMMSRESAQPKEAA